MASVGPNIATSGQGGGDGGAHVPWNNPGRITANDGSSADVTLVAAVSEGLVCDFSGFGAIAGSVINGVQVDIQCQTTTGNVALHADRNIGGDASTKQVNATTSAGLRTIGGAADNWSGSPSGAWTAANLSSTPRVWIWAGSATDTITVDYVQLTVTYTLPTGFPMMIRSRVAVHRAANW